MSITQDLARHLSCIWARLAKLAPTTIRGWVISLSVVGIALFVPLTLCGAIGDAWWSSATANAPATLLGVLIGVPLALSINRHQQETSERVAQAERERAQGEATVRTAKEANAREARVLSLLAAYVASSRATTATLRAWFSTDHSDAVPLNGFDLEQWEVMKGSGELVAVGSLQLLAEFAQWHEMHRGFNRTLDRLVENYYFYGVEVGIANQATQRQALRSGLVRVIREQLGILDGADARLSAHLCTKAE